jgi:predicted nuclease of predicted toxin-antitoxin system
VRLKLDENMPADARAMVEELGHDADTAESEGLAGAVDDDVLASARSTGRFLITMDRGMGDIRRRRGRGQARAAPVGARASPAATER